MANVTPWVIALLQAVAGISYVRFIFTGETIPAFMTWFIFFIAVTISLSSYILYENRKRSWRDNFCNAIDVLYVPMIMLAIAIHNGWRILSISTFEVYYFAAIICILGIWLWTKNHYVAFISIQAILVIGYFPTIEKLVTLKINTEPFLSWGFIGTANLVGAASAAAARQLLPFIYAVRAIIMIGITMALMFRYS